MSIALRSPPLNSLSEVRDGLLPGFQWCLRITGKLRFARATHRAVQRGAAHLRSFLPPRMGVRGLNTLRPIQRKHLAQIALHDASPMVESRC
jgi:hypothetical protein